MNHKKIYKCQQRYEERWYIAFTRMTANKPDLFIYLDYRAYLKDAFEALKSQSGKLSFRTFGKQAGFSSPNFLQQVMQGKRNLSSSNLVATAKAFKLNRVETEFFQDMVGYDQAKSLDEKNLFYQKILKNKRYSAVRTMDKSQFEFFSSWYIPVVRELMTHKDFTGDDAWMAERIFPRITVSQVEGARKVLIRLGLVGKNPENGKWTLTDSVISTEAEVADLALRNYHMAAIQLAHDAIKNFPPQSRDIRSITVGLPESAYLELKSRIEMVWKEILAYAGQYREAETVYQVNLQVFPLTRDRKSSNV